MRASYVSDTGAHRNQRTVSIVPEGQLLNIWSSAPTERSKLWPISFGSSETLRASRLTKPWNWSSAQPHRVDRVVAFDRKASNRFECSLSKAGCGG